MTSSFAIHWQSRSPESNDSIAVDVHINLWRFIEDDHPASDVSGVDYLDFGILIPGCHAAKVKFIFIYIPFKVEHNQIRDLVKCLRDPDVFVRIFNEYPIHTAVNEATGGFCAQLSSSPKDKIEFIPTHVSHKELDGMASIIDVGYPDHGGILQIPVPQLSSNGAAYFRFRLVLSRPEAEKVFLSKIGKDRGLAGSASATEIIDFKINEQRNIDERVAMQLRKKGRQLRCCRPLISGQGLPWFLGRDELAG